MSEGKTQEGVSEESTSKSIVDALIVGGGPGGTAAALRCRELGIEALVIEYDDLMKRIRDYSKDKLILPDFGGGDKMRFPKGGDLVAGLQFSPIDKDQLCTSFKALHAKHEIESRIGFELTAIDRRPDGILEVKTWNHSDRCDHTFLARCAVLAIGRGVPRRFDIPGNTDGIAFRLSEAEHYVGSPACVVGGGTSAAEAVIAISNAKIEADDNSAIYWSYRGDRLPRVSKALAEVFFEAYVGNGNIRYCPLSEPSAIVTAGDHREYLSLRVDRRSINGRPSETTHLEFPKTSCIACIGEDIPEGLLGSCGVRMATGGPRNKKRMVVTPWLETCQPGVFLVGDVLSQAHFETLDFDCDPRELREVKHRGNIKSALRDGVLVAEAIRQRLEGHEHIDVHVEDADDEVQVPPSVPVAQVVAASGPSVEGHEEDPAAGESRGAFLVRLLPSGVEADEYPVAATGVTTIGRASDCDVMLPNDTLLSARHASISHGDDGFFLRDDGSSTGVFLRVPPAAKRKLENRDLVRAGHQFLVVSHSDGRSSFIHYDQKGTEVGRHELSEKPTVLGRQAPDVTLDADDRTLSRRHLALSVEADSIVVKDLGSANGTYLRVRSAKRLEHGDQFRVGQQTLGFCLRDDQVLDPPVAEPTSSRPAPPTPSVEPAPEEGPASADDAGVQVTFADSGETLPIAKGQTVCELAEAQGVDITAECHAGICGSDPVRILSGRENVDGEPSAQERETLEELCELEPGECRLACMMRVKGPVKVEIIKG